MSTIHVVEAAASGRSGCKTKGCGKKIAKGELRIGIISTGGDFDMTAWHCFTCYKPGPRKLKPFKESHPDDPVRGFAETFTIKEGTACDLELLTLTMNKAVNSPKSPPKSPSKMQAIRKASEALAGEGENDGVKPKKLKMDPGAPCPPAIDSAELEAFQIYGKMKAPALVDYLRWNDQLQKGTKDVVLNKVIDIAVRGRLARCQDCGGKISIDADNDEMIKCGGGWDEVMNVRIACFNTWTKDSAPRLPFISENPGDEGLTAIREENKANDASKKAASSAKVESELYDLTNVTLSTPDEIKSAADTVLKAARGMNINLPNDDLEAKQAVGRMIMEQRTLGATTADVVLNALVDKLGVKKSAEEEAGVEERAANACKTAGNAPIFLFLKELSDLYFKEGNANAGASYRKATAAVKEAPFVIDAEKAKNMHKKTCEWRLEGVGKGTADKIKEFLTTGKCQKLEEKRAAAGGG
mmetsp:Transcript_20534/g.42805  ORF Transcript_20534/g.42805 Transcript_20534/m.42805 type:complete len:470 (+) Transcript_20534:30-1439(+)